uniref:(northern house mosquito) hypothetical protein n=1 Tax=Culex pipiens TaxID=7175 RepID=A0A8D8A9X6_CULPI
MNFCWRFLGRFLTFPQLPLKHLRTIDHPSTGIINGHQFGNLLFTTLLPLRLTLGPRRNRSPPSPLLTPARQLHNLGRIDLVVERHTIIVDLVNHGLTPPNEQIVIVLGHVVGVLVAVVRTRVVPVVVFLFAAIFFIRVEI